jgi:hypothetical protein
MSKLTSAAPPIAIAAAQGVRIVNIIDICGG